jgi:DNA-binding transcriptional ArsR family regulator
MAIKEVISQLPTGVAPPDEGCSVRVIHVEHVIEIQHHLLQGTDALRIAALFSVLSDPTRVQVVHALLCAPTGELCVCDLASGLGRDDSTISHQLRVLRQQKIVSMRKAGRVVYYRLIDEHIRQLLRMSIDHIGEQQTWEV